MNLNLWNKHSPEELQRRKPVWIALSEFYQDTELQEHDFQRIATVFGESGYSMVELKRINYEEVAPVLSANLVSAAGVWSGFDEAWLEEEIIKRLKKKKSVSVFNSIYKKYVDGLTDAYWRRVEEIMEVV